ncbi:hypothetical protein DUNSADRAFT_13758 [Dunaliella salina]|uniref:Uncharacterized protein n=1 Tax=Dunaliella salina TaxID=3046 RepID=A0ABQ7G8R8_DUNSA|nr:hypothetical protein DUNSADRAFT_13758 [Dunaliella salina]|eukprot:KAF5831002.1 hypothetical protein DUNSADRAFT_13758 [Dunaliella salina]
MQIRGVSARKAMQVVRAEQLLDRKEQEGSLKRLRTGIAKHEEASIVCKDTEESLCAMLRAACQLRQGNRLNNSSSDLLVAAKPQRLSAVIPEGYTYRFVLMGCNSNAVKQGLDSIRTHLEQKWQERPGEMDIAGMDTLNEESKEEIRWKTEMQVEADKRMENIVSTIKCQPGSFLPYLHLLNLFSCVEELKKKGRDLSAAAAVQKKSSQSWQVKSGAADGA